MNQWIEVCLPEDIVPGTGACALVGDQQVAIFRPVDDEQLFALSNIDPFASASVLSRGLIVEHNGELWVASPLKKERFRLSDGFCLEDENYSIRSFPVRVNNGSVQIFLE
ncbi:nitrite reductase small subunit NirD [Xenorhabdus nematophila]|uniref:Nitrite reductase (NADH) small subunit n=1 Tax=Xenorhabdus nematophila (strain ATCC 19061 / DSM 3370 / CCUG 14189 / LMG 1036 / NCIMB 9965 / AN6) TaxID=406817 RepID=D3VBU7_XENNA|nr:nitrite reductase small subunit NirD [Xenorhabdus nematophila]CEE90670.1 nitrite reductase, small subunit [Xenorhabdus nematophila str. Anatoliense]CEF33244.1 nitrite reductase, small subunit [Xenorhabdus nematophila str. Websteri]AYA42232.1 nitrite reductase small subunit NirD [Xenorhabdus nematophila]KHD28046.1 nitrite reductase [Xenorhabdus nematophila]MBA0020957.1 nitrite reductase small subunit NirD [Xenorhabdus nematophila]